MNIKNFELKDFVLDTLINTKKFSSYTDIQSRIIPLALKNRNVIGVSETGSGKSDAFLIPTINKIDVETNSLQAIIITPTRELAKQIYDKANDYAQNEERLKLMLLTGGFDRQRTLERTNVPHLIIGTPARLKDILLENALFNISTVETIVIDEIDMIFEMKFLQDVDALMSKLSDTVQTLAFSATINKHVQHFIKKYLTSHELIEIQNNKTASNVNHYALALKGKSREDTLVDLTRSINPYLCLIFASKKELVDQYYETLVNEGLNVTIIHGDLDARTRRRNMKRIENNEFQYIVASDIAARGIDIDGVSHVISTDLPYDIEFYFHRAGRTGRMGKSGECFVFYEEREQNTLNKLTNNNIELKYIQLRNNKVKIIDKNFKSNKKLDETLNQKIRKVHNLTNKKKVKPNYKKKAQREIDKIKKDYHRKQIKKRIFKEGKSE